MKRHLLRVFLTAVALSAGSNAVQAKPEPGPTDGRSRVIVTSDGEIDDECSMVRFLLYANEWDIEGIVTSSSQYHWHGHKWAGDDWAEGPTAIRVGDQWRVYYDRYRQGRYGLAVSTDLEHWKDWSDRLVFPGGARHGTIFRVDEQVLERLLARHPPSEK